MQPMRGTGVPIYIGFRANDRQIGKCTRVSTQSGKYVNRKTGKKINDREATQITDNGTTKGDKSDRRRCSGGG